MINFLNKIEGPFSVLGVILSVIFFFLADHRWWAFIIIILTLSLLGCLHMFFWKKQPKEFSHVQKTAKVLFIDDKDCQIITNLKRNNFDVRKIDDTQNLTTDQNIQWANIIFVDYKDVGKRLFGKKEGLGLITELMRIYNNKKRYIIYSSVQDFDGLTDFPYIRKNASYDEFISLITAEVAKL